jgi:hypothetical protein
MDDWRPTMRRVQIRKLVLGAKEELLRSIMEIWILTTNLN